MSTTFTERKPDRSGTLGVSPSLLRQRLGIDCVGLEYKNCSSGLTFPVGISSSGSYYPGQVIDNQFWTKLVDTNEEWIVAKTGIQTRRFLPEGQLCSDMCVRAARAALENDRLSSSDIDVIIVASITPDHRLPSMSLAIKERLGAYRAVPIDLTQTACSSIIYATWLAARILQDLSVTNVLVIGGDAMSRTINPEDRGSAVFFGDGAGALIMRRMRTEGLGFLSWSLGSQYSLDVSIMEGSAEARTEKSLASAEHLFAMNGRSVWDSAMRVMPDSVRAAALQADVDLDELDIVLLHQANLRLIEAIMDDLHLPMSRTLCNVESFGNTCSATLPTVIDQARKTGRLHHGSLVALAGVGAGFMWGGAVLRHSQDINDYEREEQR